MNKSFRLALAVCLCLAASTSWTVLEAAAPKPATPLRITTAHADAMYKQGATVTFKVQLPAKSGIAKDAELSWEISKDGVPPIHKGTVQLTNGAATITSKLDEPGFLLCRVSGEAGGHPFQALAGAAIDPLSIKPSMPAPDDFDAFWKEQKTRLAAVPMNPRLTPVLIKTATNAECFEVQLDCAGPAPVSGYFVRPRGAKPKSLPIILLLHGAGVQSSSLDNATAWCQRGMLAMDLNAHGIANGKPAQFYKDLNSLSLKDYPHAGRESRDECYFLGMFLRAIRAIDFLTAQPEWDGKTVIAYGSSQGGFQGFAVAGLDERVSFLAAGVPAGCDHTGAKANRISGWPKLVSNDADGKLDAKALQTSRYFDCVNFASRTKARGAFVTVGFIDVTCPPTSVYAAYNNLPIPKEIYNDLPTGHANSPEATQARNQAVLNYLNSVK